MWKEIKISERQAVDILKFCGLSPLECYTVEIEKIDGFFFYRWVE